MSMEEQISAALRPTFGEQVRAYRYNSVSIRVRIVSERFAGLDRVGREELVNPLIERLPDDVQDDITILLLLTPAEHAKRFERLDLLDIEFDEPTASAIR